MHIATRLVRLHEIGHICATGFGHKDIPTSMGKPSSLWVSPAQMESVQGGVIFSDMFRKTWTVCGGST